MFFKKILNRFYMKKYNNLFLEGYFLFLSKEIEKEYPDHVCCICSNNNQNEYNYDITYKPKGDIVLFEKFKAQFQKIIPSKYEYFLDHYYTCPSSLTEYYEYDEVLYFPLPEGNYMKIFLILNNEIGDYLNEIK